MRKLDLRVGLDVVGEKDVELAVFGWDLEFVEFEEVVGGIERAFHAFVGLGLVEDAVKPHFKVFRGGKGVDEGKFFFVVGLVGRVGGGVVEGRVFPVFGLFLGVSVGGVFFQGGFFRAVVVAPGWAGVQFALVGGGRFGVRQLVGVLQSPIFFAVKRVEEPFSLLRGEFLAGFGGWMPPRSHHALHHGTAFFVKARRVGANGVEVEFFLWRGVFVVGVSENERLSGMGSFRSGKEQHGRENSKAVVSRESRLIHLVDYFPIFEPSKRLCVQSFCASFLRLSKDFCFGTA